jgi:hypothetical protein
MFTIGFDYTGGIAEVMEFHAEIQFETCLTVKNFCDAASIACHTPTRETLSPA